MKNKSHWHNPSDRYCSPTAAINIFADKSLYSAARAPVDTVVAAAAAAAGYC